MSVSATGVKIFPSTRWNVKMGTNARMMIAFENSTGWDRSVIVRWRTFRRCERTSNGGLAENDFRARRTINASTITTALSMMMPKSTAPRDIRLADTPRAFIRMKANSRANGMTVATIRAALQLERKITSTAVTSSAPTIRFSATVDTVCRTSCVRS